MSNLTLQHHGIKGQKWGIRRFQNADGTRTAAGKKKDKQKKAREANQLKNPFAHNTTEHAKRAVGSAAASLSVALVGSATVKTLSNKGYDKAASVIHQYSKRTVQSLKLMSQVETGVTIINGMFTSPDSFKKYFREERRIRNM